MKLSIVIPVYNEVRTIRDVVAQVCDAKIEMEKELVIVDDGSTDGTRAVIESIKHEHPEWKYVFHETNMGKGYALKSGFQRVSGDMVLIQDADLEYDVGEYHVLVEPILAGHADVVYGSRFLGGGPHRVIFFWHYIGNHFLTMFSNMMTNLNLTDVEVCYKVFRKKCLIPLRFKSTVSVLKSRSRLR